MVGSLGPCHGRFDRAMPWSALRRRHAMAWSTGGGRGHTAGGVGCSTVCDPTETMVNSTKMMVNPTKTMAVSLRVRAGCFRLEPDGRREGACGGRRRGAAKGCGPEERIADLQSKFAKETSFPWCSSQTRSRNSPRKRNRMGRALCWPRAGWGLGSRPTGGQDCE